MSFSLSCLNLITTYINELLRSEEEKLIIKNLEGLTPPINVILEIKDKNWQFARRFNLELFIKHNLSRLYLLEVLNFDKEVSIIFEKYVI